MEPKKLTALEVAFPASVKHLMPPDGTDVPDWADKLAAKWFYSGLNTSELVTRPGINRTDALNHLAAILGSFEPRHEDKMYAAGALLAEWFESPNATSDADPTNKSPEGSDQLALRLSI